MSNNTITIAIQGTDYAFNPQDADVMAFQDVYMTSGRISQTAHNWCLNMVDQGQREALASVFKMDLSLAVKIAVAVLGERNQAIEAAVKK